MDKYTILTILVTSLVLLLIATNISNASSELVENDEYFGLIINIKETDNGFIFDLIDIDGNTIPCFTNIIIEEQNQLQIVTGTFSEDHKIFFVNEIQNY